MVITMHPCLYIDLWGLGLEDAIASPAAFFLHSAGETAIHEVKARIQENSRGLNLRRLHIYIAATNQNQNQQIGEIASVLRESFSGDFPLVRLNLCIFISGMSPGTTGCCDEWPVASLFDRCYLLSDHNEYGELNASNRQTNIKLLAYLPLTHQPASQFDEILTAKALSEKRQLFVSVGFAQLEKPSIYAAIRHVVQMSLADYLERAISTPPAYEEPTNIHIFDDEKIIKDIVSVPSCPIHKNNLRGQTIQSAENLIFGGDAMRFYKDNYSCKLSYNMPDINICPSNVTTQEHRLSLDLAAISKQIAIDSSRLDATMKAPCKTGLFKQSIKKQIAEAYALRLTRDKLQAVYNELSTRHRQVISYVQKIHELIADLKSTPSPPHESYYVKATKLILSEITGCIYDKIALDPALLDQAIDEFIQNHILNHPTIALSYEEDLHIRANASPSPESFYTNILSRLCSKAPWAIFLKRHDNLIYENFIFGPRAVLAHGHSLPQTGAVSTYLIEDPTGISLLRLVGGFSILNCM